MAAISLLNPKAEYARASQALAVNISAAKGLQELMKTNLGPAGTMKMLVSGAGDIKITKDGNVLLHEMQIQHPTASLIARASTAMDDIIGDGTTSTVLFIAELLKQADVFISEGIHPRILTEGFVKAQAKVLEVLDSMKRPAGSTKESLAGVCLTSMRTKLETKLGTHLATILLDAVDCIRSPSKPLDLHMIEIMTMQHQTETNSALIKGLVLDHGSRHPNMPKRLDNAYILICNVSLEYEKTEVNSGFFYKTAEEREKFIKAERKFIEDRVQKIVEFKQQVCADSNSSFVVINQKGIDPFSLDKLARENIMALRRAKRRNMERLALACGGQCVNSVDDLTPEVLGRAKSVYEHVLGETKYTFIEESAVCKSVTVLLRGPNTHKINMMKDAVRDGLRAIKNGIEDEFIVPGGGAFEIAAHNALEKVREVTGKARFGFKAYAEALLVIPKVLATNGGHDALMTLAKVQDALVESNNACPLGLDAISGEVVDPMAVEIHDNYCVKKQMIDSGTVIASNLLLVDEIMRAGLSSLKG